MEPEKKKAILIGIIVICLIGAAVIAYKTAKSGSSAGIHGISEAEMIWVKCVNPQCEAEYEMSKRAFYQYMDENPNPNPEGPPPLLPCEKCGRKSVLRAMKCDKCGKVFIKGAIKGDFADRCPECKYSKIEDLRKKARESRAK